MTVTPDSTTSHKRDENSIYIQITNTCMLSWVISPSMVESALDSLKVESLSASAMSPLSYCGWDTIFSPSLQGHKTITCQYIQNRHFGQLALIFHIHDHKSFAQQVRTNNLYICMPCHNVVSIHMTTTTPISRFVTEK